MASQNDFTSTARPRMQVAQEKRFAVVMYGGVSLAIYINGVVQELLRMVRATAADATGDRALYPDNKLRGTEKIYRRLAQTVGNPPLNRAPVPDDPIRVRFVVDILSGTSAGGINSIFLAKALANNQGIDNLKNLWLQEGDISLLINDRLSTANTDLKTQKPPKSLLNSQRMYSKLMVALAGMKQESTEGDPSLVDELDLFITATDITGLPIELQLADRVVKERKHRQVFHFAYRDRNRYGITGERNDFVAENDPFLAFAARCTSSFPFAFEPMRLKDIDEPVKKKWEEFCSDYLATNTENDMSDFAERAFGDGGYLDNKPFSYAIDALDTRAPQVSTNRLLIYIEPNPEKVPSGQNDSPNAIENTSAALSLARYETIREDLERILKHNRMIDRVDRILAGTEEDVARHEKKREWDVSKWLESDLDSMIDQKGISYGSYLRLRVELLTNDLSRLVIANSDWDPLSDESRAIGVLVRRWRDSEFSYYEDKGSDQVSGGRSTFHQFLLDFDLTLYIRRLEFVLRKANDILPLNRRSRTILKHCRCEKILDSRKDRERFREGMLETRHQLAKHLLELRQRWDRLFDRNRNGEVGKIVSEMNLDKRLLLKVLEEQREAAVSPEAREDTAQEILQSARSLISELAAVLKKNVKEVLQSVIDECKKLSGFEGCNGRWTFRQEPPPDPKDRAAWVLGYYMYHFLLYDLVSLPLVYATGVGGERDSVEVVRISPRDAKSLIDEEDPSEPRRKLGGTALANFGAFLDRGWRENDILWGRLDGAERLIHVMLPAHEVDLKNTLTDKAHKAILKDFTGKRAEFAVAHLTETVTKFSPDGKTSKERHKHLKKLIAGQKKPTPAPENVVAGTLLAILKPSALVSFFQEAYEIYREPDREKTVRSLARATQVTGKILEDVSDDYAIDKKPAAWVTRLGRLFWGLVEVSVPRGIPTIFARHWQRLLLLFSVLMIIGGVMFGESGARNVGWGVIGLIVVIGSARRLLGDYIGHRKGFKRLLQVFVLLLLLTSVANGLWYADDTWTVLRTWLTEKAPWIERSFAWIADRILRT